MCPILALRRKYDIIVVAQDDQIAGVLRVDTGIHHGLESAYTGVTLDDVAMSLPLLTKKISCLALSEICGNAVP
jgi:hypothetical protein